jgi:hypothetical protein
MIWLWGLIVFLSTLYGAYHTHDLISGSISGCLTGLIVVGILRFVLRRAHDFRTKQPDRAARLGQTFFGIGIAVASICLGIAALLAFLGGVRTILFPAAIGLAIVYGALGWGIRRALKAN